MRKIKLKSVIAGLIIAVLAGGNIHFWKESSRPDNVIQIGTPVSAERVNYSEAITNKEHVRELTYGLIKAETVGKPQDIERLPDARMMIWELEMGAVNFMVDAWLREDEVIFVLGGWDSSFEKQYKLLTGSWAESIKEILISYQV